MSFGGFDDDTCEVINNHTTQKYGDGKSIPMGYFDIHIKQLDMGGFIVNSDNETYVFETTRGLLDFIKKELK